MWSPDMLIKRKYKNAGFSLIELMVSMTIALFLLMGFTAVFINLKQALTNQDGLAQLQDNERLALTILTNAIQSSGYFPDPLNNVAVDLLPADSNFLFPGQGIFGTTGATGVTDTLSTRYVSASGDGLTNCLGQTNTSGANSSIVNTLYVDTTTKELKCNLGVGSSTTATPLISNVSNLKILFGTDTSVEGSIDRYLTASAVATGKNWSNVKTAKITISFVNPYASSAGQPATIDWVQIVNVMNRK
jgi:type IV pilus assembly protein PilW